MSNEKRLDVVRESDLKDGGNDVQFYSDDIHKGWVTVTKAWSEKEGWMKSTKRMAVRTGHIYQVTTEFTNPDGSKSVAEALTFVPDVLL